MVKKILASALSLTLLASTGTSMTAWTSHHSQTKQTSLKDHKTPSLDKFKLQKGFPSNYAADQIVEFNQVIYLEGPQFATSGLYESFDQGKTFVANHDVNTGEIFTVQMINGIVYVGGVGGLWESSDNGKTFHKQTGLPQYAWFETIAAYDGVIYLGTWTDGLWESFDNGKTFVLNESMIKAHIHQIVATANTIYVGVYYDGLDPTIDGLYESFDHGKTFVQNETIDHGISIAAIGVAPDGVVYIGVFGKLWQSFDDGHTFVQNHVGLASHGASQIMFANNAVYLASGYGLFVSQDDGKTFSHGNLDNAWVNHFTLLNQVIYASTQEGNFYESFDQGKTFVPNHSVPTNPIATVAAINQHVYVSTFNKGFWANF